MRRLAGCVSACLVMLPVCSAASAQVGHSTSEVKGSVRDPSGAVLSGARVVATNTERGHSRTAFTDDRGEYRFLSLRPGIYDLEFEALGLGSQELRAVSLTVGEVVTVGITLSLERVAETLTVTAESPAIEIERTQQSNTILGREIRNLPIRRRPQTSCQSVRPDRQLHLQQGNRRCDPTSIRTLRPSTRPLSGRNARYRASIKDASW